jgi:hypothetical protein
MFPGATRAAQLLALPVRLNGGTGHQGKPSLRYTIPAPLRNSSPVLSQINTHH